ncbi:MAG: cellulase family glycosylhydrolase [Candidatus Woesebacteria bacterium]|jgi:aryl-phospho-beta-D-glucosidase BglC (GH1 family)
MKRLLPLVGTVAAGVAVATAGAWFVESLVKEVPPSDDVSTVQQASSDDQTKNNTSSVADASSSGADGEDNIVEAVLSSISRFFGFESNPQSSIIAPSISGQIEQISQSEAPDYRQLKLRGLNLSGLEFSGIFQPNTEQTYQYIRQKGFNLVRLPVEWSELQPYLYGDFDSTSKEYVDQNIAWAKENDLAVVLDVHNYGRRQVYRDGGLTDDFSESTQHTFIMPYGDHDSSAGTLTFRDYGRGLAGTAANPVSSNGYKATFDAKIDQIGGDLWNEFFMDVYYQSEDDRYTLAINPVTNTWALRQTISGQQTVLASGNKTWSIDQYYNFSIDVNQATSEKINVSVDGEPLFEVNSVNTSPELKSGYVAMFPAGVKATIKDFTLDVGGDISSGGSIEQRITDEALPIEAWEDLWRRLGETYKDESTVFAYDHNEPHDLPVSTSTDNYSYQVAAANGVQVATATQLGQTMVDSLREVGDTKFVMVEMDHWANAHYFGTQYGTNAAPWISDSLSPQKVVYSGHYYFDSDHSGIYSDPTTPSNEQIAADVTPFFDWCSKNQALCYIGEFGVPNTSTWQPSLAYFLQTMENYNIWWTHWAGGDLYSSVTSIQPTESFTIDQMQMDTIEPFLD